MKKIIRTKKLIVAIAGLLLLTFLVPASSHAAGVILVPAAGLAIWGAAIVATGVAALFEEDSSDSPGSAEQKPPAPDQPAPAPVALKLQPDEG